MEQCVYWRTTQQQHDMWSCFLGSLWSACKLDWRKQIYQGGKWSKFFGHTQQNTNAGVLMRVIVWSLAARECFRGKDHGQGQEQTVAESIMWPAQQSKMTKTEKDPQLRCQAHSNTCHTHMALEPSTMWWTSDGSRLCDILHLQILYVFGSS